MKDEFTDEVAVFGVEGEEAIRCLDLEDVVGVAGTAVDLGAGVEHIALNQHLLAIFDDRHRYDVLLHALEIAEFLFVHILTIDRCLILRVFEGQVLEVDLEEAAVVDDAKAVLQESLNHTLSDIAALVEVPTDLRAQVLE